MNSITDHGNLRSRTDKEMKVAFAGDWHGNGYWAVNALSHARDEGADIVLHLGDFGYSFHDYYLDQIQGACRRMGLELWFIDGNHEDFPKLYSKWPIGEDGRRQLRPRLFHLPRGYRWEWEGYRFLAVGGAYSIDRKYRQLGTSWWDEEVITDDDIAAAITGGEVDVMVTHDCPTGVTIPGLEKTAHMWSRQALDESYLHRQKLAEITNVVKPKLLLHGHYHRRYDALARFPDRTPMAVHGLDCDGTNLRDNVLVLEFLPTHESMSERDLVHEGGS